MPDDFLDGMVRILQPGGATAGAGFVVSATGLIVTCSHVVQNEQEQKRRPPPDKVCLVFHMTGQRVEARVVPEWWRGCEQEDIAFLQIEGDLPAGVQPLPLGSSKRLAGSHFISFGFPRANPEEGLHAEVRIIKRTTINRIPALQLSSTEITTGFSGAPVWDANGQRVVGMVTIITIPERDTYGRLDETAFAAPAEKLQSVCPALPLLVPEKKTKRLIASVALGIPLITLTASLLAFPGFFSECPPQAKRGEPLLLPVIGTASTDLEKSNSENDPVLTSTHAITIAIADFSAEKTDIAQAIFEEAQSEIYNDLGFSSQEVQFRRIAQIRDEAEAKHWLHEHKVTLLVWGYLIESPPTSVVRFYILDPQLLDAEAQVQEGGEIAAKFSASFDQPDVVDQRIKIAVVFIKGLSYLFTEKPQNAAIEFDRAVRLVNETPQDPKGAGSSLDTLYFYLGRSLVLMRNQNGLALAAYQQALCFNPDYAWAYLGIGNIYFEEATRSPGRDDGLPSQMLLPGAGVPNPKRSRGVDDSLLNKALEAYAQALNIYEQGGIHLPPAFAYVTAKAHVNIGNVYSLRAEQSQRDKNVSQFIDQAAKAIEAYHTALEEYGEAGENVPPRYPAKALYGLGVIYELQGRMADASNQYGYCQEQAASDPDPRALSLKELCEERYSLVSSTPVPQTP